MIALLVTNTIVFLIFTIFWKSGDFLNIFLKAVVCSIFIANLIFLMIESGFVIRT
jgi:hypothetical protein